MTLSFANKKELKFIITLGSPTPAAVSSTVIGSTATSVSLGSKATPAVPAQQIVLQGYRASAKIDKAGGMTMGHLNAQIYGVSQSDMNACVTYPYQPQRLLQGGVKLNTVQVFAIDGDQETLVFSGFIYIAWGVYQNQPDVFLYINATSTAVAQLSPVLPTSYDGPIDVAVAMGQLANQMGLSALENNGVNGVILRNQYLAGSALDKARKLAQAAGIWMFIDLGLMAITQAFQARIKPTAVVSAQTGMIGYPTFDSLGVHVKSLFNPAVVFGGPIQIVSTIPQANRTLLAASIAYDLESEKPGGAWFMTIIANPTGVVLAPSGI